MGNNLPPSISSLGTTGTVKNEPLTHSWKRTRRSTFVIPAKSATRSSFLCVLVQQRTGDYAARSLTQVSQIALCCAVLTFALANTMCALCARHCCGCRPLWSLFIVLAVASYTVSCSQSPAAAKGKMYPRGNHWAVGKTILYISSGWKNIYIYIV